MYNKSKMKIAKSKQQSTNGKVSHLSLADHINLDKETQRMKWRIYKRKYRQKRRTNDVVMKRKVKKKEKKTIKEKRNGKAELKVNDNTKIEICSIAPKFEAVESVTKLDIKKEIKPTKMKITHLKNSQICRNENTDRETMREKWRRYKKRYREKKRYNKVLALMNSQSSPKIVEEDTAIYFVEDNFNSKDFMYENDGNEDYQFECGSADESSNSFKVYDSHVETITVKCEPSTCFFA